ncbi:bacterio-opsin activator domain-containing protein [Natronococcus occultus]|uniref:PAS domain S-box n=1 Tax=Natronococcus occultus SP4 TaxID=694430 RepID=L0JTQ1_9EURY|nr:bacterio-opsin activator domain-containing protein [Natronococcus occultus]AGB36131.1 PAS domain S-box [Natronococcus occultus SP4]
MNVHTPSPADDPLFREVVETVTDGFVILDAEGRIVFTSSHVPELLGYGTEALLGEPVDRLFPDGQATPIGPLLERAPSFDTDPIDCSLVHDTGRSVPVELAVSTVEVDGDRYLTVAVRTDPDDPSGRRDRPATRIEIDDRRIDSETRAERDESRLEALYEASRNLHAATSREDVGRIAVELVQTVLGRSYAAVWLLDSAADRLEPLAASRSVRSSTVDGGAAAGIAPISPGTVEMDAFRDGVARLFEAYPTVGRPAHPEIGLEERLVVPIGTVGLLTVGSTDDETIDDSLRNLVGILASTIQAALDRLDAEDAIRHRSAAMESATDGMGISDESGELRYVNRALADLHGYADPDELVGSSWRTLFPETEVERLEREAIPAVLEAGHWRGEAVGLRADGTRFYQDHSLTALEDGIVCVVRDVTERKSWERRLEALNEVARELMGVETAPEIARTGVDAVDGVLGFEIACVRLFEPETNQLECVAMTDGAEALLERRAAYDLEATLAGRAFRNRESVQNVIGERERDESSLFEHSSIHVPIGPRGVLTVLARSDETVTGSDVHLTEMLAMGIGAALTRAERTQLLRTQERELRQQRDQLETLNRIGAVNDELVTGLVAATTREELDRMVCEQLVASDLYRSAWIGRVEGVDDRIGSPVGAGVEEGYLETVTRTRLGAIAGGIVERAIDARTVRVLRQYRIADDPETDGDPPREVEAIAAVPLLYGDRTVGVLVINSVRDDVFTDDAIAGFESLGRIVGFAKNALKSRELLLADSIVELEFTLRDPGVFYVRISDELDCRCVFQRAIPLDNGRVMLYHEVSGADPGAVLGAAEDAAGIESARAVSERSDGFVLQTVTSNSMIQLSLASGTAVRSAVAEDGAGTIVLEAPQSADVREIVARFDAEFDGLELVAKRERERSVTTADTFRESVGDRLTDKQRAALESAYFAGYYDWPRKITAEELADSIGISSSTLHQHLRRGNWCLLSAFFGTNGEAPEPSST